MLVSYYVEPGSSCPYISPVIYLLYKLQNIQTWKGHEIDSQSHDDAQKGPCRDSCDLRRANHFQFKEQQMELKT